MADTFKKVRIVDDSEQTIRKACAQETQHKDCEAPAWISPDGKPTTAPEGTIAIVVDMRALKGAVLVHLREDNKFVGGVGTNDQGNLEFVSWNDKWMYYTIGETRLAYVKRKP